MPQCAGTHLNHAGNGWRATYCCIIFFQHNYNIMSRGRPKGRKDNPANKRNIRVESDAQKHARIQKSAYTRKKNNAAKAAARLNDPSIDGFPHPSDNINNSKPNETMTKNTKASDTSANDKDDVLVDNEAVDVRPARNVIADLDVDDGDDADHVFDDYEDEHGVKSTKGEEELGIQQQYVKEIQLRLREEVKESTETTDLYLLNHLKKNNWWIRKEYAPYFAKKFGLEKAYPAYYRDVYVWLPDIRWTDVNCKPCCPTCKSNAHVGSNGFHEKHYGRLVIGLEENYNVLTRRYCCYHCKTKSKEVKSVVNTAFEGNEGVVVEKTVDKLQYNFMGWNATQEQPGDV